jgi:hypothetical protein
MTEFRGVEFTRGYTDPAHNDIPLWIIRRVRRGEVEGSHLKVSDRDFRRIRNLFEKAIVRHERRVAFDCWCYRRGWLWILPHNIDGRSLPVLYVTRLFAAARLAALAGYKNIRSRNARKVW